MDKNMKDNKMPDKKLVDYPDSTLTRVAILEVCVANINETLRRLESKIDSHFNWTTGMISGLYLLLAGGLISVVVKLVH